VLDRHGLVERRGRLRHRAQETALSVGINPNDLWCTDYKGEFLLGNHKYCYPLKVTDHASRYLLACEALSSTKEDYAFLVFERLLASTEAAQIFRFFSKDSQTVRPVSTAASARFRAQAGLRRWLVSLAARRSCRTCSHAGREQRLREARRAIGYPNEAFAFERSASPARTP
jgi:hypothetical protein